MKNLILLSALTLMGAALAHTEFETAEPSQESIVETVPSEVTLTFSEPVEMRFSTFKVYPLQVELDPSAGEALNFQRLNGLAGALVSEVLQEREDDEARADAGLVTTERTSAEVILTLKEDLEPGAYVVMWRVLSLDSHTVQGFYVFVLAPQEPSE